MALKPKKSASRKRLLIHCEWNCTTCVQKLVAGDILQERAKGPKYWVAARKGCAVITAHGHIMSCDRFRAGAKKIDHAKGVIIPPETIHLVQDFKIQ